MTQSPEYPDLLWMPPKAWSPGRPDGQPLWIVGHTTEGSEGLRSAEAGAEYDQRRPDGTSTHFFHDQDTTVQCVRTTDRANAAKGTGNRRGIHHELCGRAAQNPAQWDDAASRGTIRNFARQAARDAKRWNIPVRLLTVAQVAAYERGFCEHATISAAFGQSDHTDPGRNYPWAWTLDLVRGHLNPTTELEDVVQDEDITKIAKAVVAQLVEVDPDRKPGDKNKAPLQPLGRVIGYGSMERRQIRAAVTEVAAQVKALTGRDFVDEPAIVAGVLAGLDPAVIAAAIPADIAARVVDELTARLAA